MIRAVIFDIDGTLAATHQRSLVLEQEPGLWDDFARRMAYDELDQRVAALLRALAAEHDVLIVSDRSEAFREQTRAWLTSFNLPWRGLFMRAHGDRRPSDEVKAAIYHEMIVGHYDVQLVLDDREQDVDMWRSNGLACWQVAKGDF